MRNIKVVITPLFIFWTLNLLGQSSPFLLTRNQALADLEIMETSLKEIHPNIYRYSKKTQFDSIFKNVRANIFDTITTREFNNMLASIVAMVRCGHTFGITSSVEPTKGFLPFDVKILENKIFVFKNFSNDKPAVGSEVLAINEVSAKDIITALRQMQNSDGYGINFKDRIIEKDFRNKYAAFIGQPDSFKLIFNDYKIKDLDTVLIAAMSNDLIIQKINLEPSTNVSPLNFTIDAKRNVAVLTLRSFMAKSIRKQSKQNLRRMITKSFKELDLNPVSNLILDLRGNTGGKVFATPLLFSYLTDKDFKIANKIIFRHGYKFTYPENLNRNNFNDWFNRRIDKQISDSSYEWTHHKITKKTFKPKRNSFKGKLYVLINGMTASAGAELASIIKANNRGVFIGEESGGDFNGVNGFDRTFLVLPYSRYGIIIAGWRTIVAWGNGKDTGRGIATDYEIRPTIEDLLSGKDTTMEFVCQHLIKK